MDYSAGLCILGTEYYANSASQYQVGNLAHLWISLCRTGFLLFFVYSLSILPQTANSCSSTAPPSNHSQRKLWFNDILTWHDFPDQWSFEQTRLQGATRLIGSQAVSPFSFDDVSEGSNKSLGSVFHDSGYDLCLSKQDPVDSTNGKHARHKIT
jgi:hypothetical protein